MAFCSGEERTSCHGAFVVFRTEWAVLGPTKSYLCHLLWIGYPRPTGANTRPYRGGSRATGGISGEKDFELSGTIGRETAGPWESQALEGIIETRHGMKVE